ncbi:MULTISPECIES: hypothetical protein [unclassified Streptomyces]|uniref:hypothetical protein n=1 Tax=unclassified Streptomyces TaxID=2593676 RepID=UPI0022B64428|nr:MULTISPECIES: hypothetical protein [unclassified Streptomyces]MCZ7414649.1 hypothetical protein [Streptomyces sp. WMMC897]MCZ7431578.1 hypothetical protein [Streptomyces sp. WMMC1477]
MSAVDPEMKRELDATLQTREELGPEYDDALVDSFLEKVDVRLNEIVDTRVRRRLAEQRMSAVREASSGRRGLDGPSGPGAVFALAVISLVLGIPLSAVAGDQAGLAGILVAWAGIVGVNAFHSAGRLPWGHRRAEDGD